MKKNRKWNTKLGRYEYLASADEVAKVRAKYDADQAAALVDPHPTSVSLPHFVERNMGAQIAAGECVVTMPKPCSGEMIAIAEVHAPESKRDCYRIIDVDGKSWTYFSAMLTVQWLTNPAPKPAKIPEKAESETPAMSSLETHQRIQIVNERSVHHLETGSVWGVEKAALSDVVSWYRVRLDSNLYIWFKPNEVAPEPISDAELTILTDAERNRSGIHVAHTSPQIVLANRLELRGLLSWKQSAESETMGITGGIYAITDKGLMALSHADKGRVLVNGSEVEPVIDTFTCDQCGEITETWCGRCYCCSAHCTCGNDDQDDGGTPVKPNSQPPSGAGDSGVTMTWLKPMAAYAALQVNRFWYYPLPEYDFVSDADYVISIDDSGEWLTVWACGETKIHVSQLDEPITKRNDPDAAFENLSWNDYVAGDRSVKPSRVI